MRKFTKSALKILLAACVLSASGFVDASRAEGTSFYAGAAGDIEYARARHEKTVDNTDPSNITRQMGRLFDDNADSGSDTAFGIGLFAGLRFDLDEYPGLYISAEIDGQIHSGAAGGTLPGEGDSAGRNQYGESWPDRWKIEREKSYGATVRVGASPEFLKSPLGPGGGIYAVGGLRRLETDFGISFTGCFNAEPCVAPDDFESGSSSRDESFWGWTAGAGIEKMLGENMAVRGEITHTRYGEQKWTTLFPEGGIRVLPSVDLNETDFSLGLLLYF